MFPIKFLIIIMFLYFVFSTLFFICSLNFTPSYALAHVPYVVPKSSYIFSTHAFFKRKNHLICFLASKFPHVSFAFCIFEICILCFHFVFRVKMEYFYIFILCELLDVCYFTTFVPQNVPQNVFIYCVFTLFSMISIIFLSHMFFSHMLFPKFSCFISCTHIF